jgi:hypothetical protein
MERRPTLPVMEILAAKQQEGSWESAPVPGRWGRPSVADKGPRNLQPWHGWTEHGRARTTPEGRQGTPAGWGQHTTGRRFRGAAPHVLRFFREGGLPAAA